VRIIQISDCHLFSDLAKIAYDVNPYSSLSQVLILAAQHSPDAILITGDISGDDSDQSYQHLMSLMLSHCQGIPWRVIPGNHDNNPYFNTLFDDVWLRPSQSWHFDDLVLCALDTRYQAGSGNLYQAQLDEVARQIDQTDKPVVLALHHPPYPLTGWMQKHQVINSEVFAPWLSTLPSVSLVIHGHLHADTQHTTEGVPVLGVPSSCWQFALSASFATEHLAPGMRVIDINKTGGFTTETVRITA